MGILIRINAFFLANFFEYCVVFMKLVGLLRLPTYTGIKKRYGNNSIKFLLRINNFNCVADPGCLCWIPDPNLSFRDRGSRVKKRPDLDQHQISILNPKKTCF